MKLLLLLFAGLKFGKLFTTGGTMLVSVVAYAWIFGWWYAVGFVGLLFIHEMGHYAAARQRGLDVGAPTFIPFLGAWITMKDMPADVETEAHVAIAGPFLGSIAAFGVYFWALQTDSRLLLAISYSGFFLNLFNLLPVSPLDGGRITAIISPRVWLLGAPLMVALLFYRPSPALFIVALLAAPQVWKAWNYDPNAEENRAYYDVPNKVRVEYGLIYLGLTAVLAIMTYHVHEMLTSGRPF
ncbi:site-2 protease family protein [Microvirga solisilvae]|uniref:site-2 protease family protein n=1 Tax=Microvirga solisilvae TaxID=2919498 RepID=UPI001FAF7A44|nr:site-2 protease family protein [Microvirga solisilvae]